MTKKTDILIIGSGMSGLAAAFFASKKGLSSKIISTSAGCMGFAPGTLDLCSVHPVNPITYHDSPIDAIKEMIEVKTNHPYAYIGVDNISQAWKEFGEYLSTSPLSYSFDINENVDIITAVGSIKPSNMVPRSLKNNADAWKQKKKTLIVDIKELKNFSSKMISENLKNRWKSINNSTISIEDIINQKEIHILKLCSLIEKDDFRKSFINKIKKLTMGYEAVGLPEICGFTESNEVLDVLEKELGISVFEIPGPPPTGSGNRLLQFIRDDLINKGVEFLSGHSVEKINSEVDGIKSIDIKGLAKSQTIKAENVILATGRFFGGGLIADKESVKESVFNIPVQVQPDRDSWHMNTFLGAPGHDLNSCGITISGDGKLNGENGKALYENLYAVGSIIGNQDWVREKSGTGIAVSTAWNAIDSITGKVR